MDKSRCILTGRKAPQQRNGQPCKCSSCLPLWAARLVDEKRNPDGHAIARAISRTRVGSL